MNKKDLLGSFVIPSHLLRQTQSQAEPTKAPTVVEQVTQQIQDWTLQTGLTESWQVVEKFKGSSWGSGVRSTHTVQARRMSIGQLDFKCSCQSFRIQKKGRCKHTDIVRNGFETKFKR